MKLFIIDGNSLINRAFYALPLLSNENGVYSNAVFGFVNCLVKLITEDKPDRIVVAFDHARKTFRNELFEQYKGTRKETPVELRSQFPILKEVLKAMNIYIIEQEGIEADDIIGTIASNAPCENFIITGDRDSLQLIDSKTRVWLTQKGITDVKEVNNFNIKELYELTPKQIIDFKALCGDKSDNIPGVPGIGEKTAINLLNTYNNIDNIYNNLHEIKGKLKEKLEQNKDLCYLSYKLATIKCDCNIEVDIDKYKFDFPFDENVKKLFENYQFKSLLKRDNLFKKIQNQLSMLEIQKDITYITDFNSFENLINNFNQDYFSFNIKNDFCFSINDKEYIIQNNNFDGEFTLEKINNCISKILLDKNIIKIAPDIKSCMHYLNNDNIKNFFDISLASHLISGSNKPQDYTECDEFYNIYQKQIEILKENQMINLYFNIELPLIKILYDMEKQGFKIDKQTLNNLEQTYTQEENKLKNNFNQMCLGLDVNINSPKQLSELLFDKLKLSDKGNKKHSTGVDVLTSLQNEHPIIPIILRYRKVNKFNSTYIKPYLDMLKSSDIIHTVFKQMLTSTGRLSSTEPNLQNIPIRDEEGRTLRKMFVSRFENGCLISADYSQIELRLLANFSNDKNLIDAYKQGSDIHTITASQIFEIPSNQVTSSQRRMAKAVNFGIVYGISGYGLSQNIDVPVSEAKKYIDVYFKKYPDVKTYLDDLITSAKNLGYAKTLFNRRRNILELSSSNKVLQQLGERIAMNMPLQGSASDLIKIAMINIHNNLKQVNAKSKLILQIHDELIIDTYPGEEELVTNILQTQMQNVYNFEVPLLVNIGQGKTLYDC